jgi:3-ketoacyl-CoA synthase
VQSNTQSCQTVFQQAAAISAKFADIHAAAAAAAAAGIHPQQIDILVTNCSIYCPTPSLASMLVNQFKMRQDIQSYHLGGMGCGNGVMALSLIRDLLQVGAPAADQRAVCAQQLPQLHRDSV